MEWAVTFPHSLQIHLASLKWMVFMWCLRFELFAKVFSHSGHFGMNCELLLENTAWKSMAPMLFVLLFGIICVISGLISIVLLMRLSLLLARLWLVSFWIVLVLSELSGDIFIMCCVPKQTVCARFVVSCRTLLVCLLCILFIYLLFFMMIYLNTIKKAERDFFLLEFFCFRMWHIDGFLIYYSFQ